MRLHRIARALAVVGTAQLTSTGTAVLRFAPGSGSHSYIAVFAGTTTNITSTSTPQAVTVSSPTTFPTTTSHYTQRQCRKLYVDRNRSGYGERYARPNGRAYRSSILRTATLCWEVRRWGLQRWGRALLMLRDLRSL